MDFQHNECKQIQCYVLTCPSVNLIWETPMLFQWDFISMFKCQFHMGNSNVIPMGVHLHVQSQTLAIDASKYNVMSWHFQVSISYGKLQCYSNETSSPCTIWKLNYKLQKHIEGHQNLVSILWKWDTKMGHHIGGMGHIKSGTPIIRFNA